MARRDELWNHRAGGYIEPASPTGFDILIKGDDKYINFKSLVGITGYGFRDNNGVIEVKNSDGSWTPITPTSGNFVIGDGTLKLTVSDTEPSNPTIGDLWYDTN